MSTRPRALVEGSAYVGYRRLPAPSASGSTPQSALVAQLGLSLHPARYATFGVLIFADLTYFVPKGSSRTFIDPVSIVDPPHVGHRFDVLVSTIVAGWPTKTC